MTRLDAVKTLIDMANALCLNPDTSQGIALKMAIRALSQQTEDAISRQATLEPYKRLKDTDTLCVALIRANIMQQPSIKPQEPPKHTKCDRCPYGETKVVNICNYDGDGCGWD